jgi:hypothetical protein
VDDDVLSPRRRARIVGEIVAAARGGSVGSLGFAAMEAIVGAVGNHPGSRRSRDGDLVFLTAATSAGELTP